MVDNLPISGSNSKNKKYFLKEKIQFCSEFNADCNRVIFKKMLMGKNGLTATSPLTNAD